MTFGADMKPSPDASGRVIGFYAPVEVGKNLSVVLFYVLWTVTVLH
jgi:hypothetical protein